MRLYAGKTPEFIKDVTLNQIAAKLGAAFFDAYRYRPGPAEVNAWRNSLRAVAQVLQYGGLDDHGVILEYQLPMTSLRLDCLVCGRNGVSRDSAVIIELKQWDRCIEAPGDNEVVTTFVGGRNREMLHPSVQVGNYKIHLEEGCTAFYEEPAPVLLSACSYLHNYPYDPSDHLFAPKFAKVLAVSPVFTADDVEGFCTYLNSHVGGGQGADVLSRIEAGRDRPARKLMDHVASVIKEKKEYVLLDEQLVVFDKVLACAKEGVQNGQKTVIVVRGGPGTGKSVIAMNLMAELLGQKLDTQYATGSRAFTRTLRKIIGSRGSGMFRFTSNYQDVERDSVDVLICDEAHRIREFTWDRWRPRSYVGRMLQVQELIAAAKTSVFFIDDHQVILPTEIGSADYVLSHAVEARCRTYDYQLDVQFRCAGSAAFVSWIDNTLGIQRTPHVLWDEAEGFDFRVFGSPEELELAIRKRVAEGFTGRVVAGFCWKWSQPDSSGQVVDDVVIGDWRRPWNARPNAGVLAPGIPPSDLWAYEPNGINQVGCIYTAQGFEFDYVGVIVGRDLVYDFVGNEWRGDRNHCADRDLRQAGDRFLEYVKNRYRVLLSRGMKGCYAYFQDEDTAKFFRTRIEVQSSSSRS